MINQQPNNRRPGDRFHKKKFNNFRQNQQSPILHILEPKTKSFVAENLNRPEIPKKKLIFVRKSQDGNNQTTQKTNNHQNKGNQNRHRKVSSNMAPKKEQTIPELTEGNIRIVPLGGVEEVGKNMTAIEYGNDIIVIDAGIQFKTEETPGIDYILPNTKYLEQRKGKIKALVITHGHLDHIGAIPFVMEAMGNPPIYTREFGALLIKKRQSEFPHLPELNLKIVDKNTDFIPISKDIKIKFFGTTHSIPDSNGVIIETPLGDIVSTGDVRVENDNGVPREKEFEQYKIFENRKVLLLMMDSTGIEKPGWGIAESVVIDTIDNIVKNVPGRVIIATFSSQVERILHFIKIAEKYGKKLVVEGRSMKNNMEVIKFLKLAETKHIIPVEEIHNYPPHKLMVLSTGAQGEEFAALMRMSNNSHKYIKLNKTDTVILSSSVIPGNERSVATLKDNLFRHDSKIITYTDSDVHAGGHGKRGELEWIHKHIPYKFFMPVHGHHFMLKMHAELAVTNNNIPRENIAVADNGSIVEIIDNGSKIKILKEKAPSGIVMVDGFSIGDVQEVVIRDRQMLAQDGMFVIIASIDVNTGKLKKSPDIISRGFVYLKESQDLLKQTRFIVKKTVEENAKGNPINFDILKETITDNISRYLFQETAKKPMVIPVVIGV
jgi:ribonuclease J